MSLGFDNNIIFRLVSLSSAVKGSKTKMPGYNVDEEVELLANHIKRLGKDGGGGVQVTFKVLAFTLNQFQV